MRAEKDTFHPFFGKDRHIFEGTPFFRGGRQIFDFSYAKHAFKPVFWEFLQSKLEISDCVEFSACDSQMKFWRK